MRAIDIINSQREIPGKSSFDRQFARDLAQVSLNRYLGQESAGHMVAGVVAGSIGGIILYHLLFRKK